MTELLGLCHICGRPAAFSCKLCGRPVCREHIGSKNRICAACRPGRS